MMSFECLVANNISESLAESAAAYTKATAKRCLLEKVEVITGEEAESNVLQVRRQQRSAKPYYHSLWKDWLVCIKVEITHFVATRHSCYNLQICLAYLYLMAHLS